MASESQSAKDILLRRRSELRDLSTLTAEDRDPVTLDQQSVGRLSRMDALQMQAMAQESERRRLHDLARIEAALRRIDEDEYGYCVDCGDEIPIKRLEIDPAATHCVRCATRAGL